MPSCEGVTRSGCGASDGDVMAFFMAQGSRLLGAGLALSALLSAAVLFVIGQVFSVGVGTLALIGAVGSRGSEQS